MRSLLVVLVVCAHVSFSFGQSVGLVKGSRFIDVHYGLSRYSIPKYGAVYYGMVFKEQMALRFGGTYENGAVGGTDFNILGGGGDYIYSIYNHNGKIYLNSGAGVFGGVELLESRYDFRKGTQFVFGGRVFGAVNFSVGKKVALGLEFSQWYSHLSKIGNWYYTGSINMVYNLN